MSTGDRAFVVVLYMPDGDTSSVLVDVAERWEEIISSASTLGEYATETGSGNRTLSWSIARVRYDGIDRIVAGAGGMEAKGLLKVVSTSGVDDDDVSRRTQH